jgi:hypothetical protein
MIVNCFTVTISSDIYSSTIIKELSNEFGENIPKSLCYEGGQLGFITHLFCVDIFVNVKEICNKYKYDIGKLYKIEIDDNKYNNNYIIHPSYKIDGPRFYLLLE